MITFKEYLLESASLYPISETPAKKQFRKRAGLTKLITVDAKKFKDQYEKDHGEPLNWNNKRLENLRKLHSEGIHIDAHPEIGQDVHGKLSVGDGRHRISHAAELGMKIKVAVNPEDSEKIKDKIK